MPTIAEPELGYLLEAFQLRHPDLSERFDAVARPILRRMAKKRSWGLPSGTFEDIVQEAFLALSNPTHTQFDPARGTATQYLHGRLKNAVKTIQIVYGLRRIGTDFEKEPQREFVSLDDLELNSQLGIREEAIYSRHTIQKMFAGVDDNVRNACLRVYGEDESQSDVAAELHIGRFTLARRMSDACATALQMVAAA
jgi:DNA-directed RNA polymerase specialized sigma24 family protein